MSHVLSATSQSAVTYPTNSSSGVQSRHFVTLVEPALRAKINIHAGPLITPIHADSVRAAYDHMHGNMSGVLLISPQAIHHADFAAVRRLVRDYPGASSVAVVGERAPHDDDALLVLGACGVRTVINLSRQDGVGALRRMARMQSSKVGLAILDEIRPVIQEFPASSQKFFYQLIRAAPTTQHVTVYCRSIGVGASTMNSRFFRYRLPPLKKYLALFRLLYVVGFFEDSSISMARVATQLNFSSPQALSRHFHTMFGLTCTAFRAKYTFDPFVRHVVSMLFAPYYKTLCVFEPMKAEELVDIDALLGGPKA